MPGQKRSEWAHGFGLEALDEDAVEQRCEGLDVLECGGLGKGLAVRTCVRAWYRVAADSP